MPCVFCGSSVNYRQQHFEALLGEDGVGADLLPLVEGKQRDADGIVLGQGLAHHLARLTPYFFTCFIRDCLYAMSCIIRLLMKDGVDFS